MMNYKNYLVTVLFPLFLLLWMKSMFSWQVFLHVFLTGMEYCGNYAYKLDLFKLFILCWKVFVTVLLCKIKIMYLWHIYFLITSGVLQTLSFVSFLSWFLFLLNNVRFRVMLIVRWPFWLQLMVNLLGGQNFNRRFQKKGESNIREV